MKSFYVVDFELLDYSTASFSVNYRGQPSNTQEQQISSKGRNYITSIILQRVSECIKAHLQGSMGYFRRENPQIYQNAGLRFTWAIARRQSWVWDLHSMCLQQSLSSVDKGLFEYKRAESLEVHSNQPHIGLLKASGLLQHLFSLWSHTIFPSTKCSVPFPTWFSTSSSGWARRSRSNRILVWQQPSWC